MTLSTINITDRDHQIAKLSAIAVALSLIEFFFPSPIPGVKPGIANIIILYTIFKFDLRMRIWVSLIRVFVTSILLGSFLSPTFFLSLSGALFSLLSLIIFRNLNPKYFSLDDIFHYGDIKFKILFVKRIKSIISRLPLLFKSQ